MRVFKLGHRGWNVSETVGITHIEMSAEGFKSVRQLVLSDFECVYSSESIQIHHTVGFE